MRNKKILLTIAGLLFIGLFLFPSALSAEWNTSYDDVVYKVFMLNESSGTIYDSLGTDTGTNNGASYTASGFSAGAYDFESGSSNYISLSNTSSYIFNDSFTVNLWWKPESHAGYQSLIGRFGSSSQQGFWVAQNNGEAWGFLGTSACNARAEVDSNTALALGAWNMITFVYDEPNDKIQIYVNGTWRANQTASSECAGDYAVSIGRLGGLNSDYSNGVLDEIYILNSALSPSLIMGLYDNTIYARISALSNLTITAEDTESPNASYSLAIENPAGDTINNLSITNSTGTQLFYIDYGGVTDASISQTININYTWNLGTYTATLYYTGGTKADTFDVINSNPAVTATNITNNYQYNTPTRTIYINASDVAEKYLWIYEYDGATWSNLVNSVTMAEGAGNYTLVWDISGITEGEVYTLNITVGDYYNGETTLQYNISVDFTAPVIESVTYSTATTLFNFASILSACSGSAVNTPRKPINVTITDNLDTSINCTVNFWNNNSYYSFPNNTPTLFYSAPILNYQTSTDAFVSEFKAVADNTTATYSLTCYDNAGNNASTSGTVEYSLFWAVITEELSNSITSPMYTTYIDVTKTSALLTLENDTVLDLSQATSGAFKEWFGTDASGTYCGQSNVRKGYLFYNTTPKYLTVTHDGQYFRTSVNPSYYAGYNFASSDAFFNIKLANYTAYSIYELVITVNQALYNEPVIIKRYIGGNEYHIASAYPSGSENQVKFYLIGNYQYNIYVINDAGQEVLTDVVILTSPDSLEIDIPSFSYDVLNVQSKSLSFYAEEGEANNTYTLYALTNFEGGSMTAYITNASGYNLLTTSQNDILTASLLINASESGDTYYLRMVYSDGETKNRSLSVPLGVIAFASVALMSAVFLLVALGILGSLLTQLSAVAFVLAGIVLLFGDKMFSLHPALVWLGWLLIIAGAIFAIFRGGR